MSLVETYKRRAYLAQAIQRGVLPRRSGNGEACKFNLVLLEIFNEVKGRLKVMTKG